MAGGENNTPEELSFRFLLMEIIPPCPGLENSRTIGCAGCRPPRRTGKNNLLYRLHARLELFGAHSEAIEQAGPRMPNPRMLNQRMLKTFRRVFDCGQPARRLGSQPQNQRSAGLGV